MDINAKKENIELDGIRTFLINKEMGRKLFFNSRNVFFHHSHPDDKYCLVPYMVCVLN